MTTRILFDGPLNTLNRPIHVTSSGVIHFVNFKLERDGQPRSADVAGTNGFPCADLILEEAQVTVSRSTGGPSRARPTTTQNKSL